MNTGERRLTTHAYLCIVSNCTGISVTVTEMIALQRITEGLLFDTEVVDGPDICNDFGHAPVGKVAKHIS